MHNPLSGPHILDVDVRLLDGERLGKVAGAEVAVSDLLELRSLLAADLLSNGATRVETAARRRIDGRRRIAGKDDALASLLNVRIRHGNSGQQRLRVRMMGLGVERLPVGKLDHLTQVHNGNAIGDVLHNGQVVSDEQIRGAKLVLSSFSRFRT